MGTKGRGYSNFLHLELPSNLNWNLILSPLDLKLELSRITWRKRTRSVHEKTPEPNKSSFYSSRHLLRTPVYEKWKTFFLVLDLKSDESKFLDSGGWAHWNTFSEVEKHPLVTVDEVPYYYFWRNLMDVSYTPNHGLCDIRSPYSIENNNLWLEKKPHHIIFLRT